MKKDRSDSFEAFEEYLFQLIDILEGRKSNAEVQASFEEYLERAKNRLPVEIPSFLEAMARARRHRQP